MFDFTFIYNFQFDLQFFRQANMYEIKSAETMFTKSKHRY